MKKIKILKISNVTEKAAYSYFVKKAEGISFEENLTKLEKRAEVKKIKKKAMLISGLLGASGVFFLFLPRYVFPQLVPSETLIIPFTNLSVEYSVREFIYSLFLVAIEIWLLMKNDLRNVGKISKIYDLKIPDYTNKIDEDTQEMVLIGLGKDKKRFIEVGINPYQNFSKPGMFLIRVVSMVKAFLTNFALKITLRKVFGRIAIRAVTDIAAIPIYAFWNAYASSVVMRRADMRMLAGKLMVETGKIFHEKFHDNIEFKNLIYDTLEYIAIAKRNFYPTDYFFAKHLLNTFEIKIKKEHKLSKNYLDKIQNSSPEIKKAISQILIIGFLIDGKSGAFEIRTIKKLIEAGIILYSIEQIKKWSKDYSSALGFDNMFIS